MALIGFLYFEPRSPRRPQRKLFWLIENKTVDVIHPVHRAKLLTYLKLSERFIGFLINWKAPRLKDGIQRMIWRER
jgi:hypothetical protein